jgi:hypothetical protein
MSLGARGSTIGIDIIQGVPLNADHANRISIKYVHYIAYSMPNTLNTPIFNSQPYLKFDKNNTVLSFNTVLISKPSNFRQWMPDNSFKFVVSARAVLQDKAEGSNTSRSAGARVGYDVIQ